MGADLPATAEGELGRTPLAHLLVYAIDRRLDGVLFFREPSGVEHVVRVARGAAVKVRPGDRFALLGEMLVEAGAVSAATVNEAVAMQGLLGDVLLLTGRVDRDALERVAEQQFIRRMVRLFSLPSSTSYRYCEGHGELHDYGGEPATVDPLSILWAGVRAHGDASTRMEASLARLGEVTLRLHALSSPSRFGFSSAEQRVIEALERGPLSMRRLAATGHVPEETVRRLCYTLLITRQLDVGSGALPIGAEEKMRGASSSRRGSAVGKMNLKAATHRVGAAAPDPAGDGERSTWSGRQLVDVRAALKDALKSPDDDPHATLKSALEAPIEASSEGEAERSAVRHTYPELHVEVLSQEEQDALRELEGSSEIRPSVSVRGRGKTASSPGVEAQVTVLSAPVLFELATRRFAEQDLEGALEACALARRAAPGEPDYAAFSVWIRLQMPGADLKTLAIELDEVLAAHVSHVQGRYYRAVLRRRLSDDPGAIRDLRRVIELFPAHPEAAKELSALEARRPKDRGGILGRLFKR